MTAPAPIAPARRRAADARRARKSRARRSALRRYTGSEGYARAVKVGAARIGLDGQPAGVVTEREAEWAQAKLAARRAKREARLKVEREAASNAGAKSNAREKRAASPPAEVKRLSIEGLREAARRRADANAWRTRDAENKRAARGEAAGLAGTKAT